MRLRSATASFSAICAAIVLGSCVTPAQLPEDNGTVGLVIGRVISTLPDRTTVIPGPSISQDLQQSTEPSYPQNFVIHLHDSMSGASIYAPVDANGLFVASGPAHSQYRILSLSFQVTSSRLTQTRTGTNTREVLVSEYNLPVAAPASLPPIVAGEVINLGIVVFSSDLRPLEVRTIRLSDQKVIRNEPDRIDPTVLISTGDHERVRNLFRRLYRDSTWSSSRVDEATLQMQ